jgi:hypothetical protein
MNTLRLLATGGLVASLFFGSLCFASEGSTKTVIYQMAEIMHRLKHFPSPQGKKELQAIIDASGTTANERIIAKAMMNLEHHPAPQDIPLLQKVLDDKASTNDEREIASIVLNLNHRPTPQDKNRLKGLMK